MAQYLLTAVEGTTSSLLFQLLQGGAPINLTGCTVTLALAGNDGVPIQTPAIQIIDVTNGKVQYTPTVSDLTSLKSPYAARFQIVNSAGQIQFVPSGYRDEWNVVTV